MPGFGIGDKVKVTCTAAGPRFGEFGVIEDRTFAGSIPFLDVYRIVFHDASTLSITRNNLEAAFGSAKTW